MIRIPRHWTYYIFGIVCFVLAFQSDEHLFSFIGVNIPFNFLARIGLLVWTAWLLLLGVRGGAIFGSMHRVSYASFSGGYAILWKLFGLGLLLLFLGSFAFTFQSNFSPQPTTVPLPTPIPTKTKPPTI